jgi:hypothetical protein
LLIFAAPPPSRLAPTPRLDLPGHHRLPTVVDLNVLVDVLNKDVLLAPQAHRARVSMPASHW